MDIRNTFHPARGRISVIHRKALCCVSFLVIFSGPQAAAIQEVRDSLTMGKHAIDLDACRSAPVSTDDRTEITAGGG